MESFLHGLRRRNEPVVPGKPSALGPRRLARLACEAQGTLATLDEGSGRLELETDQGLQTFAFEREDLQIRFRGDQAGFQELGAGRKVIVRYVEEDGEKVARSVEVYAGKRVSDEA